MLNFGSLSPTLHSMFLRSVATAAAIKKNDMTEKQAVIFNMLDMTISYLALKILGHFGIEINGSTFFLTRVVGFSTAFVFTVLLLGDFSILLAASMSCTAVAITYFLQALGIFGTYPTEMLFFSKTPL